MAEGLSKYLIKNYWARVSPLSYQVISIYKCYIQQQKCLCFHTFWFIKISKAINRYKLQTCITPIASWTYDSKLAVPKMIVINKSVQRTKTDPISVCEDALLYLAH